MRCPSCGAIARQNSISCLECGAIQDKDAVEPSGQVQFSQTVSVEELVPAKTRRRTQPARSLIEFPGAAKNSKPQWRKELGERVREVQERKAREALMEAGELQPMSGHESRTPLELLPRAETPPVNPIVVAALQRIERANIHPQYARHGAAATMLAYAEQAEYSLELPFPSEVGISVPLQDDMSGTSPRPEKTHNLAVVPPLISEEVPSMLEQVDIPMVITARSAEPARKPKRTILGDLNDPALNYLDSIPVAICVDVAGRRAAPVFFRLLGAILDLVVVSLLSSPVVAMVKLTELKWQDPRTLSFAIGTFIVMGFLYLTIATAFTGRTLGMKLLSLRVVDARTGLIPTGGQSAARALVYILSLASAGIVLMYTFVNDEGHAPHDRLTRTAVVRV